LGGKLVKEVFLHSFENNSGVLGESSPRNTLRDFLSSLENRELDTREKKIQNFLLKFLDLPKTGFRPLRPSWGFSKIKRTPSVLRSLKT